MLTLELTNVGMQLLEAQDADGTRVPVVGLVDQQSGIRVVIPFAGDSARQLAAHLEGRPHLEIARGLNGTPLGGG